LQDCSPITLYNKADIEYNADGNNIGDKTMTEQKEQDGVRHNPPNMQPAGHADELAVGHGQNGSSSNILKVKADPPDISEEDRKKAVKALAGAISHGLRRYGEVKVRAFGPPAVFKAAKAVAIASGNVAVHGFDLYARPSFIEAEMGGKTMTGICFICVTSQSGTG